MTAAYDLRVIKDATWVAASGGVSSWHNLTTGLGEDTAEAIRELINKLHNTQSSVWVLKESLEVSNQTISGLRDTNAILTAQVEELERQLKQVQEKNDVLTRIHA